MVRFQRLYEADWRDHPEARELRRAALLHRLLLELAPRAGLPVDGLAASRLAGAGEPATGQLGDEFVAWASNDELGDRLGLAHRLGQTMDALAALDAGLQRADLHTARKKSGSFFTPPGVARAVIERSLPLLRGSDDSTLLRVCDPAVGGGAFLLEAARALIERAAAHGRDSNRLGREVHQALHGFDQAALAIAVSEAALWLYLGDGPLELNPRLVACDTLAMATTSGSSGYDWIVGNPPWVAFQGRAARPLSAEQRAYYRRRYRSFRGYPTLHALFVERAAELAPRGVLALLLPSSLSDLDGYRDVRTRLTETHRPEEPLREFGQDAFLGVVQPCFGLVARPRDAVEAGVARPWQLEERARQHGDAKSQLVPPVLVELMQHPTLPRELFRELGLQTNRKVTAELLLRSPVPQSPFSLGLLEGRRVQEFACSAPELFLHVHRPTLERTKCLLRPVETYQAVAFVVRQTASFPIAAAHNGTVFRNSLLAGFTSEEFDRDLLLGLLNSALYRAFHVAGQRDARQATFPQVKLSHLRKLPCPPADDTRRAHVRRLSAQATAERALAPAARIELDAAVFGLFGLEEAQRRAVLDYLAERAPAALTVPRSRAGARSKG